MRGLLLALLLSAASGAAGQGGLDFALYGGYNISEEEIILGLGFEHDPLFHLGTIPVAIRVDFERQFYTFILANAYLTTPVVSRGPFEVILGGGLAVAGASLGVGAGLNVLGGVEYDFGSTEVFARYRLSFFEGGTYSSVFAGPKFAF